MALRKIIPTLMSIAYYTRFLSCESMIGQPRDRDTEHDAHGLAPPPSPLLDFSSTLFKCKM